MAIGALILDSDEQAADELDSKTQQRHLERLSPIFGTSCDGKHFWVSDSGRVAFTGATSIVKSDDWGSSWRKDSEGHGYRDHGVELATDDGKRLWGGGK